MNIKGRGKFASVKRVKKSFAFEINHIFRLNTDNIRQSKQIRIDEEHGGGIMKEREYLKKQQQNRF
jgi:hypothetical protein